MTEDRSRSNIFWDFLHKSLSAKICFWVENSSKNAIWRGYRKPVFKKNRIGEEIFATVDDKETIPITLDELLNKFLRLFHIPKKYSSVLLSLFIHLVIASFQRLLISL